MRILKPLSILIAVGVAATIAVILSSTDRRAFGQYVFSPVPKSVRVLEFQSDDWFAANPEPVVYLAFSATAADIEAVIQAGFRPAPSHVPVPVPKGTVGWKTADDARAFGRPVYHRKHAHSGGSWFPVGRNRGWDEYLWTDETGTNGFFLLWGI